MQLSPYFDQTAPEGFYPARLPEHCQTPMMLHYISVKAKHPDAVLFYRMGDFYEMFFEDAELAAKELGLTLTSRNKEEERRIPMAGFPHHSAQGYIDRLIAVGYRVAICEQVEDPRSAKGMVRREVTRIVTPSLVRDPLEAVKEQEFLIDCVYRRARSWVWVRLNTISGSLEGAVYEKKEDVCETMEQFPAQEILLGDGDWEVFSDESWIRRALRVRISQEQAEATRASLAEMLSVSSLDAFGVERLPTEALPGFLALVRYVSDTQRGADWAHLHVVERLDEDNVRMSGRTLEHLDVLTSSDLTAPEAHLMAVFSEVLTGMGRRQLATRLRSPSRKLPLIGRWQQDIQWWVDHPEDGTQVRSELKQIWDLERLAHKVSMGSATPPNLKALEETLVVSRRLSRLWALPVNGLLALEEELHRMLEDTPALDPLKGRVIRAGVDAELDERREFREHSQEWLARYESGLREETGISSLKVKFNKVFGFSIEVTKANVSRVPEIFQRKQTLVNGERYVTGELKEFEQKWLTSEEFIRERERSLFETLLVEVRKHVPLLMELARAIGELDVAQGAALKITSQRYCLPRLHQGRGVRLVQSRHPVLEHLQTDPFVPNTVEMDEELRFLILTGPNMSGKSTLMRQVALTVLLAHAGLPVPASEAAIGCVDQIFTRVGAHDRLSRGQSTFMVEMIETASILRQATERSLVVLDEIGRGTSTFDGISIAWAVAEDLIQRLKCLTLFATHYHELVALERLGSHVRAAELAIQEWEGQIIFLRQFRLGACQKSYGVNVARLAGLPGTVVKRAEEKLQELSARAGDRQLLMDLF